MLLEVEGLSVRFGGLTALADVTLAVAPGEITAVIGPNGAGKTTLFAAISGFLRPQAGRVRFAGREVGGMPPERLCALGLVRTFQVTRPFAGLTVRENIAVAAHLRHASRKAALALAERVAARVRLEDRLDRPAAELTLAGRKRLELARALATEPRLLLLDEVLAGLNPAEVAEMEPVIRGLRADGITVLLIEHVMQAVMRLSDRVWVLVGGRIVASGPPATVVRDPAVIEAYLGRGAAERLLREDALAGGA
ncbi:MAG: ABC transporter ATP-binding protein [Geminicoccaceae bacterium]|jgi:branched-chain amino acid transport system ATP-binding protein|nr:MAG: ABC transporter ATP-binding protein [Geminicoccaceae bacterium]